MPRRSISSQPPQFCFSSYILFKNAEIVNNGNAFIRNGKERKEKGKKTHRQSDSQFLREFPLSNPGDAISIPKQQQDDQEVNDLHGQLCFIKVKYSSVWCAGRSAASAYTVKASRFLTNMKIIAMRRLNLKTAVTHRYKLIIHRLAETSSDATPA